MNGLFWFAADWRRLLKVEGILEVCSRRYLNERAVPKCEGLI